MLEFYDMLSLHFVLFVDLLFVDKFVDLCFVCSLLNLHAINIDIENNINIENISASRTDLHHVLRAKAILKGKRHF